MQQKRTELNAAVVKLADAPDSKSGGLILRVGSSPTSGTKTKGSKRSFFVCTGNFMMKRGREPKVRAEPCAAKRSSDRPAAPKQKGASAPFLFIRKIFMGKKRTRTEGSGEALRSKAEQRPTGGTQVCRSISFFIDRLFAFLGAFLPSFNNFIDSNKTE